MCDNCQQYLYQFLNEDYRRCIDEHDPDFDFEFKTCFDYLTEIQIHPNLYRIISNKVRQDFNGSNSHDIEALISFIAIGVENDQNDFFYIFVHFVLKHDELFFGIVFRGLPIRNTNKFPTEIYKYCFEVISLLFPNTASEA